MMGKKNKAINIQFVFPEGKEVETKEEMIQVLKESYLRAVAKGKKKQENKKANDT
ncbi:hypothetical protein HZI73_16665 [Vallitalea pronyensis]|uniref:Uncharacterized protein n=1 Tax=Vallitalea pronyensis TaxID=1348613 RepID=A0A8J8ML98_9FIRM|nr:hypothetical protein [Vallitalea pronyensis]QUI23825.1 hypothetical protein HZI73_16665 [Vallitalea pronyensis]